MKKKSMQKSIKNLMPIGIDFCKDFIGFWIPKTTQVGTKMGSKMDTNSEGRKPTKRQPASVQLASGGRSWKQKLTKNQAENEIQDGMDLGTDY